MEATTKKSNSFVPFLETFRSQAPDTDSGLAVQQIILGELLNRKAVPYGELIRLTGLPPVAGKNSVDEMISAQLIEKSLPVVDGSPVRLTAQGNEIALAYSQG